jgi:hypothetical protein
MYYPPFPFIFYSPFYSPLFSLLPFSPFFFFALLLCFFSPSLRARLFKARVSATMSATVRVHGAAATFVFVQPVCVSHLVIGSGGNTKFQRHECEKTHISPWKGRRMEEEGGSRKGRKAKASLFTYEFALRVERAERGNFAFLLSGAAGWWDGGMVGWGHYLLHLHLHLHLTCASFVSRTSPDPWDWFCFCSMDWGDVCNQCIYIYTCVQIYPHPHVAPCLSSPDSFSLSYNVTSSRLV